jgi:hypothetical protein
MTLFPTLNWSLAWSHPFDTLQQPLSNSRQEARCATRCADRKPRGVRNDDRTEHGVRRGDGDKPTGVLSLPAPAHAGPPIPVPPNCNDQFLFTTTDIDVTQDDGTDVFPATAPDGTTISGPVYYMAGPARKKTTGTVVGGINGNTINFSANWDTGGWNKYTGTINAETSMAGVTLSNTGDSEHWSAGKGSLYCAPPGS